MGWLIIQSIINGLLAGGVYALVAVGVTIIFGVMRMVNFANSAFLLLGMYVTWLGYNLFGLNAYLLVPFIAVITSLVAVITYKLVIQPVMKRTGTSATIIVTVGLAYAMQNLLILIFGKTALSVPSNIKTRSLVIGNYTIGLPRLIAFCAALILVFLLTLYLNRTHIGKAMLATSENVEVSEMLGINTKLTFTLSWILGIALTGIAGALLTPIFVVETSVGTLFRFTALVAVVLGGLGSIKGAFISGLILGVIEAFVASFIGLQLGQAGMFIVFFIVLFFRPFGIFGKGERVA